MVQIVRRLPSPQTQRQQAFDSGLDQFAQGAIGGLQGFENQAATKRQQALDLMKTTATLRDSGYDVTPEQLQSYFQEQPNSFKSLFGSQEEQIPQAELFAKRTPEFKQKQQDILRKRKLEQAQLDELSKPYSETIEGKKFITQENIKTESDLAKKKKELEIELQINPLGKISGEDKNKVGSIATGLQSLDEMENAIAQGYEPEYIDSNTPILGKFKSDNPLTKSKRMITEVIGRLQSGGAIGVEEEKRFNEMSPRPGDTPEIAAQKIQDQRRFLENKLRAYGLNRQRLQQAGFEIPNQGIAPQQQMQQPNIEQQKMQRLQELRAKKAGAI